MRVSVAEFLHAKDPVRFGKLVAELFAMQLLTPESVQSRRSKGRSGTSAYQRRRPGALFSTGARRTGLRVFKV